MSCSERDLFLALIRANQLLIEDLHERIGKLEQVIKDGRKKGR